MRVAIFTSQFPSRVSTFFARDVRGLIEAGIEPEIFPLYPLDPALWQYVPGLLDERILPRERVHHVDVRAGLGLGGAGTALSPVRLAKEAASVALPASAGGPGPFAKTLYALAKARAWARASRRRFDHVLSYWGNYAATSAIAFQRMTDPSVPVSTFLHAGTDLYRAVALRAKLRYVDRVIVVCRFNLEFLAGRYPDLEPIVRPKAHVHHIGLDLEELPWTGDGRPAERLVAVGSFERAKGFDVLLRAVALLSRGGRDVVLDLVGDGPQRPALSRLTSELGIAARVRFRGWLAFDGVREAMREATLLVHPSVGLGDAVPTVIKEALALGTPVVASRVAGIPELLDEGACGVLVPAREPELLADAIAALLADEVRRRALSRMGRAFAEETFDLRRNGRRLADVLRATRRSAPGGMG